jgi:hypothetical protein
MRIVTTDTDNGVRRIAIDQLLALGACDEGFLCAVASANSDRVTRREALRGITSQQALAELAKTLDDSDLRSFTISMLKDQGVISQLIITETDPNVRGRAIEHIEDQRILVEFAVNGSPDIRTHAIKKVTDEVILRDAAKHDEHPSVREAALGAIINISMDTSWLNDLAETDERWKWEARKRLTTVSSQMVLTPTDMELKQLYQSTGVQILKSAAHGELSKRARNLVHERRYQDAANLGIIAVPILVRAILAEATTKEDENRPAFEPNEDVRAALESIGPSVIDELWNTVIDLLREGLGGVVSAVLKVLQRMDPEPTRAEHQAIRLVAQAADLYALPQRDDRLRQAAKFGEAARPALEAILAKVDAELLLGGSGPAVQDFARQLVGDLEKPHLAEEAIGKLNALLATSHVVLEQSVLKNVLSLPNTVNIDCFESADNAAGRWKVGSAVFDLQVLKTQASERLARSRQ